MGAGASAVGSGLDERLASALGTATAVTTPAALEAAFQSFSNQLRQQQLVEETEPDFTLDVVASDSELGELAVAYSSKMGTAVGASPTSFTYAINADCTANFSVLVSAIGKCCEATSNSPLKLNVSSSSFSEDAMEDLTATNVISLCIGNTAVRDFASVSMGLNVKKLLSLDLSFSESLELTAGSFILLSNLRRLNLDGCGITSTSSEKCLVDCISSGSSDTSNAVDSGSWQRSIFVGLVCLADLSLNENNMCDVRALDGLISFFSMPFCNLHRVSLIDNEDLPHSKYATHLATDIKTLHFVDNRQTANYSVGGSATVPAISLGRAEGISAAVGHGGFLDEKEFLMALKNERDVTVVS